MSRKQSLSDKIYQRIKQDIVTCVFAPGEEIVQADLAKRYKIGMTPVREALLRLAREGFVKPFPRLGHIVTAITSDDVREIYELRAILEAAATRLAAVKGDDEQLKQIAEAADFSYDYQDLQSYSNFVEKNKRLHLAIANASGNRRLAESISRVFDESQRFFHLGLTARDTGKEMRERHSALAQAISERNADLAEQLVRAGINRSQQIAMEGIERYTRRQNSLH